MGGRHTHSPAYTYTHRPDAAVLGMFRVCQGPGNDRKRAFLPSCVLCVCGLPIAHRCRRGLFYLLLLFPPISFPFFLLSFLVSIVTPPRPRNASADGGDGNGGDGDGDGQSFGLRDERLHCKKCYYNPSTALAPTPLVPLFSLLFLLLSFSLSLSFSFGVLTVPSISLLRTFFLSRSSLVYLW